MTEWNKETSAVHAGGLTDDKFGGVNSPVYTSSAFNYIDSEILYPRYFNSPNHDAAAAKMAELEKGEAALITSSGMAAISSTLLALLNPGDHIIVQGDVYGGTHNLVTGTLKRLNIRFDFANSDNLKNALRPETRIVYIESPSNPLLKIADVRAVAELSRAHNLISIIDNTFASPINQNPLELGIDLAVHSGTKYLGGHSDLCCGAIIGSREHILAIRETARDLGGSLNAQDCSLLERSLKTLEIRVSRQNENALKIARFLASESAIARVFYPGLEDHEYHSIAAGQMSGFGGILAFEPADVDKKPRDFMTSLRLIKPAVSLGGVESTICSPADTSHALLSPNERLSLGISDSLLRLSVGIENADDLIDDLKRGLS